MNGRMYDPLLGRVLSPDNNVLNALGTQDYNRYSYARNNPIKYNDPTGWKAKPYEKGLWGLSNMNTFNEDIPHGGGGSGGYAPVNSSETGTQITSGETTYPDGSVRTFTNFTQTITDAQGNISTFNLNQITTVGPDGAITSFSIASFDVKTSDDEVLFSSPQYTEEKSYQSNEAVVTGVGQFIGSIFKNDEGLASDLSEAADAGGFLVGYAKSIADVFITMGSENAIKGSTLEEVSEIMDHASFRWGGLGTGLAIFGAATHEGGSSAATWFDVSANGVSWVLTKEGLLSAGARGIASRANIWLGIAEFSSWYFTGNNLGENIYNLPHNTGTYLRDNYDIDFSAPEKLRQMH